MSTMYTQFATVTELLPFLMISCRLMTLVVERLEARGMNIRLLPADTAPTTKQTIRVVAVLNREERGIVLLAPPRLLPVGRERVSFVHVGSAARSDCLKLSSPVVEPLNSCQTLVECTVPGPSRAYTQLPERGVESRFSTTAEVREKLRFLDNCLDIA